MIKKILIVNPFGIGDTIFSTPLIEILKKEFPRSYIAYICNKRTADLMKANPFVDRIFVYEKDEYRLAWGESKINFFNKIKRFIGDIKKENFDISIDLSLSYQFNILLWLVGIKKRLGFNYRNRGKFLTDKLDMEGFDTKHVIEYYLDVLSLLNINTSKYPIKPKIYIKKADSETAINSLQDNGMKEGDLMVGIIPGCGASWGPDAKYRRWDSEKFGKVAAMLVEKEDARIILLGNRWEKSICDKVAAIAKKGVLNYCAKTSIVELAAIISRCKLVITNDGGPLHMAVGLSIPTVSIFGPVDEKIYGPYPANGIHTVISKKGLTCRPCYKKFKYTKCENRVCLDNITPEEVYEAAKKIIGESVGT